MNPTAEALQAIYDRYGRLDEELVVAEAEDPAHPLHNRFEWDDTVAAHRYRLDQAGEVIRRVRVLLSVPQGNRQRTVEVRRWAAVDGDKSYRPVAVVADDPLMWDILMEQVREEFQSFRRKLRALETVAKAKEAGVDIAALVELADRLEEVVAA